MSRKICFAAVFWAMSLFISVSANANHLTWMEGKKNAQNIGCCQDNNCRKANVQRTDADSVIIDGVHIIVNPKSIFPTEDAFNRSYYCYSQSDECGNGKIISHNCLICVFHPRPKSPM